MLTCMQDGNFTLRSARIDEAERVLEFYELNRESFLLPRPATDFQRAVTRGQHFIVEQNKQIVAASGVFDYADNIPFVELSETLVLPSLLRLWLTRFIFSSSHCICCCYTRTGYRDYNRY